MTTLSNKTALVTGGSTGIGYATAAAMLRHGMNVTITGRSTAKLQSALATLDNIAPGRVIASQADTSDYAAQENSVAATLQRFGGLDVLVANAGVGVFKPVQDLTLEDWHSVVDTNLTGVFYSVKASIPALTKTQGYIITVSSLAGKNPFALGAAYNASKFGLNGLSESIMLDLRDLGIKVSTIMPGSVATHFNNHTPNENDAWKIQPEDIAQMVLDLLRMPARTLPSRIEVRPSQPKK